MSLHYLKKTTTNVPERAPLVPIKARSKGGYEYALGCVGHFTRFVQVYATKNKPGLAAADKLFSNFILKFAYINFQAQLHHKRHRITRWGMDKRRG